MSFLGCASLLGALLLVVILAGNIQRSRSVGAREWFAWFGLAVPALVVSGSLLNYLVWAATKSSGDAVAVTTAARARFIDIHSHARAIAEYRNVAEYALARAHVAFAENQYGEFWDAIEDAMKALSVCQNSLLAVAINIDQYLTLLNDEKHNFPPWYAGLSPLQDLTPLVRELASLKKRAGSSIDFATIGQIRSTGNQIAGVIAKLGEAIRHLEVTMTSSLDELRRAVNRSTLFRAADPAQIQVIVGFLFSNPDEE